METSIEGLHSFLKDYFKLDTQEVKTCSPLTLAYIGDAVYELIIRTIIVDQGNAPVNKLHKKSSSLVNAKAQAQIAVRLSGHLTDEEIAVYKRGRNAKSHTAAKNASITDYRLATGFEALVGYLYLNDQMKRLVELIKWGLEDD